MDEVVLVLLEVLVLEEDEVELLVVVVVEGGHDPPAEASRRKRGSIPRGPGDRLPYDVQRVGSQAEHRAVLLVDRRADHAEHARLDADTVRRCRADAATVSAQSGMLPCFFGGFLSRLLFSMLSAPISRGRVSAGMITSSM